VLAQYNEDLSWSDKYASQRTVYCKGGAACSPDAVRLENVGREGHTYLSHIVNNYDKLAKWTVFSQAGEPTVGYKGQNQGGGHMLNGATFSDYLVHPHRAEVEDPEAFFLMTSKMHMPTLHHALRSSYNVLDGHQPRRQTVLPSMCPAHKAADISSDVWGSYEDMPWLRSFVSDKCGVEEMAVGEAMLVFWDSFVQLPRPQNDIVHYAQGARFAVSRDRIQQRSKAFYERLLSLVSTDVDPCLNYLYEWAWYYIVGTPQTTPCTMTQDETAQVWAAKVRMLIAGMPGLSGMSGMSGNYHPKVPTPAPDNQMSPTPAPPVTPAPATPAPATPAPATPAPATPAPAAGMTVVEGSLTMSVADPVAFCAAADETLAAVKTSLAQVSGVDTSAIDATCTADGDRRLSGDARRLDGEVAIGYTITTSAENAAALVTAISTVTPEALTLAVNKALDDAGSSFTVEVTAISPPESRVVGATTTTLGAELSDHACTRMTVGSSVALAASMVGAMLFQ
jgi:hypothetical protein